jgi:hypothetical protein
MKSRGQCIFHGGERRRYIAIIFFTARCRIIAIGAERRPGRRLRDVDASCDAPFDRRSRISASIGRFKLLPGLKPVRFEN